MKNEWCAIDLHMHVCVGTTGDGKKDEIHNFTYFNYINALKSHNVKLAAITNHNHIDLKNYLTCRFLAKKSGINILFGVELDFDSTPNNSDYHYVLIFDETLNHCLKIEQYINDKVIDKKIDKKVRFTPDEIIELIKEYNVILIPHGSKSKGLLNHPTEDEIIEALKKIKDGFISVFDNYSDLKLEEVKKEIKDKSQNFTDTYGCVLFSDNRDWSQKGYDDRFRNFYMNAEPTFKGFMHSITNPSERFALKDFIPVKTTYISKIKITKNNPNARIEDCTIDLNSGYNCIIGKSGSGKSLLGFLIENALSDKVKLENYSFSSMNDVQLFDNNNHLIDKNSINFGIGKSIFEGIVTASDTSNSEDMTKVIRLLQPNFVPYEKFNEFVLNYKNQILDYKKLKDDKKMLLDRTKAELNTLNTYSKDLEKLKDTRSFNIKIKQNITFSYSDATLKKLKYINKSINSIKETLKLIPADKNSRLIKLLDEFNSEYFNLMKEILIEKRKTEFENKKIEIISNCILKINKDISLNSNRKNEILVKIPKEIKTIANNLIEIFKIKLKIRKTDLSIKLESINSSGSISNNKNITYKEIIDSDLIKKCNEKSNDIFNTRGFTQTLNNKKDYNLENKEDALKLIDLYLENGFTDDKINKIFDEVKPQIELYFDNENVKKLNPGTIAKKYINFYFDSELSNNNSIIIYDQIENHVDKEFISTTILNNISRIKKKTQVIIITHDPIVAINADPVNYIKASKDENGHISYSSFSFESLNYDALEAIINNVDGSFEVIKGRYGIYNGEKEYGYKTFRKG